MTYRKPKSARLNPMMKLLRAFGWLCLLAALATFAFLGVSAAHGHLDVTVNGQQVEGAQKLVIGSIGFLMAGLATLVAIGIAALAVAGSGLIVFISLAFVALILVAVAIPFLLPIVIPILVVAFILGLSRQKSNANRT